MRMVLEMSRVRTNRTCNSRSNTKWVVVRTMMVLGVRKFHGHTHTSKHKQRRTIAPARGGKVIMLARDLLQLAERSASRQSE